MSKNNQSQRCGCNIPEKKEDSRQDNAYQRTINIKWQRLVTKSETCPRCRSTENELDKAIKKLQQVLVPLGIKVVLEKEELNISEFKQDPLQSNRIWINQQPLENFIKGEIGQSPCCDVCGPTDCRTIEINGKKYETIPADLIIQAGLAAATQIFSEKDNVTCCDSS